MKSRLKGQFLIPVLAILIFYILARMAGIGTGCYIKGTFGIPCPGCGMTRAFLHLFRGDLAGAFYYHPLFLLPAVILILLIYEFRRKARIPVVIWIVSVVLMLAVYAVRMILYFPDTAPMDYYSGAVLPRLLDFIR
ncbi:DUF2752 domain-containing protein [Anaerobium acetethylicum]|uniref:DUF2752 domain-containing protein n=1 Tax=Anaerobium acetethylicum TaxID=1619234 RepID=A0A1D3TQZ8_9FIRM|nr:DUF2752 domain-containing protein [Anaerobium acetethylicum]SCP96038.1 Protein of unknown function [Anaerobium acetethylicum]